MKGGKYRNPIDKARRDYEYAEKDKKWAALEAGEQIAKIIKERNKLNSIIQEVSPYFNQGLEYIELYDESLQNFAQKKPMIEAAKKAKIPLTTINAIEYTPVRFYALKYNSDRAGPPLLETSVTVEEVEDEPNMIYAKVEKKEPVKIPAEDLNVFLKRLGITKYNVTHVKSKKMKKNVITEEQRKAELERARQQKSINDETEEYISDEDEKLKQVETTPAKFIIGKTEEQKAAEELADRIEQAKYKQLYEQKEEEKEEKEDINILSPQEIEQQKLIAIARKEEYKDNKELLNNLISSKEKLMNDLKTEMTSKQVTTSKTKPYVHNKSERKVMQTKINDYKNEIEELKKKLQILDNNYKDILSGEGYYYPRFKNKIYRY